mmetsp:Transcript_7100/g.13018  ORF Transcript_7100/g.13018 Transcript_7100/m.13018 type:complete len:308 (-) Transcript_7100:22-945(-)|eukprot:CAMPEP_0197470828 /NCGR_PEP_ID=MMETSP1309-20131121/1620_1 /TAXON_ID=464262 /ORGANISM="Genus nov. species nov., Strain RCC998" /LENGTH=307 /DNA_ID=CAMNT_0043008055 /DNA_START=61 /DNA_END=984 /DNA_ORIENTATION=-
MTGDIRLRMAFNRTSWQPEGEEHGEEFRFLLGCLSAEEAGRVTRFKFFADKQRALVSHLMQRKCIELCLGMEWDDVEIKRTKGRKPFVANAHERPPHVPNFNYNVSHEGDYIILASEPVCIVGVDVAAPGQSRRNESFSLDQIFSSFKDQFTDAEWTNIRCFGDERGQEDAFRRNWSCKEAFTKARGDGIGFNLQRCEFIIEETEEALPFTHQARVHVDGKELEDWAFYLQPLGDHWVTVARGPPSDVVDAYGEFTKTLRKVAFSKQAWEQEIRAGQPGFAILGIRDLLPSQRRKSYEDIVDEDPFC